jgi:nucleotide-binding universal stress UspA family protein
MSTFNRILCAIDFSETSMRALDYAATFAVRYGARLAVLHVGPAFEGGLHSPVRMDEPDAPSAPTREDTISDIRRAVATSAAAALGPAIVAEEGRAHDAIMRIAASLDADLLVIGTHGRSGFNRLFLGSVAEKVVRTAPCPVLTVAPAAGAPRTPVAFRRILCPVDFSPSSLRALHYAYDLGRQDRAQVTVLHVLEYLDVDEPCEHVDAEIRRHRQHFIQHARERLHEAATALPADGCQVEEVVAIERAYREILRRAADDGVDLVVQGAQGHGRVELMLYGSNTQHVVRGAPCPVLTVRA